MRLTRRTALIVASFGLIAAACSGDPDAELRSAIDQKIAGDLAFADEDNARCVGDKILLEHDRLDLESRGLGTEDLLAGDGDLTELFGDREAALPATVLDCVDADQRFIDAVSAAGGVTPAAGCIDAAALTEPKQAGVVLYDDEVEIDTELRELVRPCLSEEDFATLFDLDQPADLVAALVVDPLELMDSEDSSALALSDETNNCLGTSIVDEIGVEALDAAGITVEQPVVFHPSADLDQEQAAAVDAALTSCDAIDSMLTHVMSVGDPEAAACAVDSMTESDRTSLFEQHLEDTSVNTSSSYREGLDDCINELLEEQFGPATTTTELRISARDFAAGFLSTAAAGYDLSSYESKCVHHRSRILMTPELTEAFAEISVASLEEGLAIYDRYPGLLGQTLELNGCFNPDKFITWQFATVGFSQGTIDCIFSIVDAEARKASMDVAVLFQEDASAERVDARLDAEDAMAFAVGECASLSELSGLQDLSA